MKHKITIFLIALIIFLFFAFNKQLFIHFQQLQLTITKEFVFSVKKQSYYWGIFIFLYGLLHSIGPGHGKIYLLTLSVNNKKPTLLLYSALIAYFQGIISYIIVYVLVRYSHIFNTLQIKYIDEFGKNVYGITLMILGLFNLVSELIENKTKFFVIGVFFPCSGLLSLLLALTMLGYQKYLLLCTFLMATGMFVTLATFSIFLDKFHFPLKENKKTKILSLGFYLFIFSIGFYVFIR